MEVHEAKAAEVVEEVWDMVMLTVSDPKSSTS